MFRDIKRDAFHRSHPLVPAMNASTTPSPPSSSPVSLPFRAHVHTHTHTQLAADNTHTGALARLWPTRPALTPLPSPLLSLRWLYAKFTAQPEPPPRTRHLLHPRGPDARTALCDARLLKDKAASNDLPMSPIYRAWGRLSSVLARSVLGRSVV